MFPGRSSASPSWPSSGCARRRRKQPQSWLEIDRGVREHGLDRRAQVRKVDGHDHGHEDQYQRVLRRAVKRRGLAYVRRRFACRCRSRSPAGPGAGLPYAVVSASPAHASRTCRPAPRRCARAGYQSCSRARRLAGARPCARRPGSRRASNGSTRAAPRLVRVDTPPSRSGGKDQPARARSSRLARARTRSGSGIAPSASMLSVIDPGGIAALVPDQARHVASNLPSDLRLRCARPCTTTHGILPYSGRLDQISLGRISALTPSPD